VTNLISPGQVMNTFLQPAESREHLRRPSARGQVRDEIIFEGTSSADPEAAGIGARMSCKVKPGDPNRRPGIISPYHHRLDWHIWFRGDVAGPSEYPWTIHFAVENS
jgi:hypothetical protein